MNDIEYKQQIGEIREAAKQTASTTGILQTVYFASISYLNLKTLLTNKEAWFFYVPILLWLITLLFSMILMFPNQPLRRFVPSERQYSAGLRWRKVVWISASILFFLGLAWMSAAMIRYLFFLDLAPPT